MPSKRSYDVTARYLEFAITTAKKTTLKTTTINLGNFLLEEVTILWAPGHVSLTGIRILTQGTALLPWNQPTSFILGNNQERTYEMNFQVVHALTVQTQNNDIYSHQHILTFKVKDIPLESDAPSIPNLAQTPVVF